MSQIDYHKCPNCGGNLYFDIKKQLLVCEHCDSSFEPSTFSSLEQGFASTGNMEDCDYHLYVCNYCGGETIVPKNSVINKCPYCGTKGVILDKLMWDYERPTHILPFKLEKKEAFKKISAFLKKDIFTPKEIKGLSIDNLHGIFIPFWMISGTSICNCYYDYGKTDNMTYCHKTVAKMDFNDIPVDCCIGVEDSFTRNLEPFAIDNLVEFNTNYLSGFMAYKADLKAGVAIKDASKRAGESIAYINRKMEQGNNPFELSFVYDYSLDNVSKKMVYIPIWILFIRYNSKTHKVIMDGYTGKISGDIPFSYKRIFSIYGAVFGALALLMLLIFGRGLFVRIQPEWISNLSSYSLGAIFRVVISNLLIALAFCLPALLFTGLCSQYTINKHRAKLEKAAGDYMVKGSFKILEESTHYISDDSKKKGFL